MAREKFSYLFLIVALILMSFGCSFNVGGSNGSISFSLPQSECFRTSDSEGEVLEKRPDTYKVEVKYADGKSVLDTVGKAGENIFLKELVSGQYIISLRGETPNFVFIGEAVANVVEEQCCEVEINVEAWKKGQIKINFEDLDKSVRSNLSDFTVKVFDSGKKEVYSQVINYSSLPNDKMIILDKTFPAGDYTIKLMGGNPDFSYRVNKDIKVSIDYGKIFRCAVSEHEAINYFISSSGNDDTGTGEKDKPYKSFARIIGLLKDIHVPVRITLLDDVTENGLITFNIPHSRVVIDSVSGSKLLAKGGINVLSGRVMLDNNANIGGGKKITVGPDGLFVMKGSAKVLEDTVVSLQPGALLRISDNLTNSVAAHIEMTSAKNKSLVLDEFVDKDMSPIPDLLKNNYQKIKFVSSQSYDIKDDCKAWASLPAGYVGIDDALTALTGGSEVVKVFVDDVDELNSLVSAIKSTSAAGVNLDLRTNPRVSSIGNALFKSNTKLKSICIPSTITSIGNEAFNGCSSLIKVDFGSGVTSIGDSAFNGCSSLTSVELGSGVTSIGDSAFNGCSSLTSVELGSGVTSIGNSAFVGSGLTGKLTIPSNIKTIGSSAFASLPLTEIVFNEGLETIGSSAFNGCTSLSTKVIFPASLKTLGDSAFTGSTIKDVEFKGGLTSIGASAFSGCAQLRNVITIPSSVQTIGNSAFENSAITGVLFSEGLTSIGASAFKGATSLTGNISFPASLKSVGNNAFENDKLIVGLSLNSGLTSLGDAAFIGCSGITGSITIPGSIKNISTSLFENCSNISSVNIGSGIETIFNNAFKGCTKLTSVSIPSGVTSLRSYAFASTGLRTVTVPSSVWGIYDNVFNGCTSLTSVSLNEGVTSIGESAFNGCSTLGSFTVPVSVISIGKNAFTSTAIPTVTFKASSSKWDITTGGNVEGSASPTKIESGCSRPLTVAEASSQLRGGGSKNIKVYVASNSELESLKKAIQSTPGGSVTLDLRTSLKELPREAFANCTYLTSVKLPEGITSIGKFAFANDINLASITLPKSLTRLVDKAFSCCWKLDSITIPSNVTTIDAYVFNGCDALNSVTFDGGNSSWNLTEKEKPSHTLSHTTASPSENATALKKTYLGYIWQK